MSDSCQVQLHRSGGKVVAEIPSDVISAMGWSEDQTLQLIKLDDFGVLLSEVGCSEIEEIEVVLEQLQRAIHDAHQAVNETCGQIK